MSIFKKRILKRMAPCHPNYLCKQAPCEHTLIFDSDYIANLQLLFDDPEYHSDMWFSFWYPYLLEGLSENQIAHITAHHDRCARLEDKWGKLDDEWQKRREEMEGRRIFWFKDDPPLSFTAEEEETMERNFQMYCQDFGENWNNEYFMFRKAAAAGQQSSMAKRNRHSRKTARKDSSRDT